MEENGPPSKEFMDEMKKYAKSPEDNELLEDIIASMEGEKWG